MLDKCPVKRFIGAVVEQDDDGNYQLKRDKNGGFKLHQWRIGRHTKGSFKQIGQVFLCENHLRAFILKAYDVPFKKRHAYQPLERFLDDQVSDAVIKAADEKLGENS